MQKNLTMRPSTFFLSAALAASFSCSLIDPPVPMGEPRGNLSGGTSAFSGGQGTGTAGHGPDTTFLVSAISFPESYDWRRDSAYGAVSSTLLLYRNGSKCLEVPAGPAARISVSPDMHHILGGALYTEYADNRGTAIKKDGKDLLSWPEQEKLFGLLVRDGTVHTVGQASSGRSLTYRVDGQIVLNITGGSPFGNFSSCGYGTTGALYLDSGHVCFSYKTRNASTESAFLVKDGKVSNLMSAPGTEILDAKVRNGTPLLFYNDAGRSILSAGGIPEGLAHPGLARWIEGRIIEYRGHTAVEGSFVDRQGIMHNALGWAGGAINTGQSQGYVYCDGQDIFKIDMVPPAYPECFLFHRNCACLTGDGLAIVLTPKETGVRPYMKSGSKTVSFNLYGYLSGIAMEITE